MMMRTIWGQPARLVIVATAIGLSLLAMGAVNAMVADPIPRTTAGIDPLSDPDEPSSPVFAVAEANGRYYIGGDFQTIAGETQPYLAAIEVATGRLDQLWRPSVNAEVTAIAVAPDGSAVYVGGKFNSINGSFPSRIAKLDPVTGAVDTNFDPDADAVVEAIVTDGTSVWVSGNFSTIGGVARSNIAKLDSSGLVDPTFDPNANGKVLDLELDQGRLYLSGNFTVLGGAPHLRIASVDAATGAVDPWAPTSNFKVYDVSVHPDGTTLYAAGAGSLGSGGNSLTAWDTATGTQLWRRVNSGDFQAVVATDDLVYIGTHGEYVYIDNNGPFLEDDANPNAVRRNKLAAFDPATGDLDDWNPGANSVWGVWFLGQGPSGLLIGGDFTTIGGQVQPHFAVLDGPGVGNKSPVPAFSSSCTETTCTFDGTNSSDSDGTVTAFAWDFGNGLVASGPTALITFGEDSMNTVSLTVTDDAGTAARTQDLVPIGDGGLDVELVSATAVTTQGSSVSSPLPLDLEEGDFAVAFVSTNDSASTVIPPDGWAVGATTSSGSLSSGMWFAPVGAADAGATVAFQFDTGNKADLTLAVFRNVDLANPIAGVGVEPESALWGEHSAPSITTAVPATVMHYWADRSGDTDAIVAPGNEATVSRSTGSGGGHINSTLSLSPTTGAGARAAAVAIGGVQTRSAVGWTLALAKGTVTPICTAVLEADETVSLTWTDVRRAESYVVRRNNSWVASVGTTVGYVDDPGPGAHDYVIRVRSEDVTTDVPCTPTITIDEPPPFVQTCAATRNIDESITVNWDDIPGENGYSVRRNNSYLASAGDAGTYTDSPGPGTWAYIIRSKKSGITTNTNCTPTITIDEPPPFVQTCTATVNGDGSVTLVWDAIPGEDSYQVRRNGSWVETTSATTYTDLFAVLGDTHVIKSRMNGVTANTDCV